MVAGFRDFWRQTPRYLAVLLCLTIALTPILPRAAQAPGVLGNWVRSDGATHMTIATCGAQLCAVNTAVRNPNGSEKVGDKLVMTLRQTAPHVFSGKAFDVRRNKSYAITLTLTSGGMKTSGCILFGVVCKSTAWTRAG